jgi:hypothetical protein
VADRAPRRLGRQWLVGLALAAALMALIWALSPSDPIGPGRYHLIREGMTRDEVIALIGMPPGDYHTLRRGHSGRFHSRLTRLEFVFHLVDRRGSEAALLRLEHPDRADSLTVDTWWGNQHMLQVVSDSEGKVVGCALWKSVYVGSEPDTLPKD